MDALTWVAGFATMVARRQLDGARASMEERSPGDLTSVHVRFAIDGANDSVAWLIERFTPLLRAQARYRLGRHLRTEVDPEDLVNEVWLTALARLPELAPTEDGHAASLVRFLSRTLVYKVNNLARRRLRRGDVALDGGDDAPREVTAEITGVVSRVLRDERRDALHDALETLGDTDREILVLRGIEQQSNGVVATLLGITEEASAMRYHRALQKIRARVPRSVLDDVVDD